MARAKQVADMVMFECPACGNSHGVTTPRWTFNGNYDLPTFTPSVRVTWEGVEEIHVVKRTCHFFVTDGKIQYCGDSTHKLAGQTVDLPELE